MRLKVFQLAEIFAGCWTRSCSKAVFTVLNIGQDLYVEECYYVLEHVTCMKIEMVIEKHVAKMDD